MVRLLATVTGLLLIAGSAGAAVPAGNGRYLGFEGAVDEPTDTGFTEANADLRISSSGRVLRRGSYVDYDITCRRDRSGALAGRIALAGERIRRDGTLRLRGRQGKVRFRLSGSFREDGSARLAYRVRRPPSRPRNRRRPGVCAERQRSTLFRNGVPPFSDCRTQRADTKVIGATGRIFGQFEAVGSGFFPRVYGCLFETNKRFDLGQDWDDEDVELERLAGPYAGYFLRFSRTGQVIVVDLRDGRRLREITAPELGSRSPEDLYGRLVEDLELKENGSVAWISYSQTNVRARPELWAQDANGTRLLDSSPDIDAESLTLSGSTLAWSRAGAPQTATLD